MAKLRTHVHVHRQNKAGEVDTAILEPGVEVPSWAEKLITNADAWAEPPAATGQHATHPSSDQSGSR